MQVKMQSQCKCSYSRVLRVQDCTDDFRFFPTLFQNSAGIWEVAPLWSLDLNIFGTPFSKYSGYLPQFFSSFFPFLEFVKFPSVFSFISALSWRSWMVSWEELTGNNYILRYRLNSLICSIVPYFWDFFS